MPRRVLQVLARSAGGMARHVAQVVSALDGRDDLSIDVAAPPGLPVSLPKHVHEIHIPRGPLVGHRAAVRRLLDVLEGGRYDLVHAHGLRAGMDAARAARATEVPIATTVHNLVQPEIAGPLKAPLYRRAEGFVVRSSELVFAVSRDIADHLSTAAGRSRSAGRIEVLHLGVGDPPTVSRDGTAVRDELGLPPEARLVVTASRLVPQKAVHVLLAAVAALPENVHLAVLGEGRLLDDLRGAAAARGIADRVSFLGFRTDAADVIDVADAFCLSSIWEGIPLAAQEAILLGTPVVATNVGGMDELIVDGESGRLVPKGDPGALADALAEILGSDELRAKFVARARSDLVENFSTTAMLERLRAAYVGGLR